MNSPLPGLAFATSRTWAEVDLGAIAHNVRALRALLPPQTAFMAVVKADAYGHGLVPVAEAALEAGATWLGVATPEEALDLRAAGLGARILVLGPVDPSWLPALAAARCALTAADRAALEAARRLSSDERPRIHLKVDTGMRRLGTTLEDLEALLDAVDRDRLVVEGVFTHLACADEPDPSMTRFQLAAFREATGMVRARFPGALAHAANSAAVMAHPEAALDLVRVGIALYGAPPAPHLRSPALRPAMSVRSRVVRVQRVAEGTSVSYGATYRAPRPTAIATVPVGYADGYPRALSNVGTMLVGGIRHRVAGRVCMDYTMFDVGEAPVRVGDEVTVFGSGLGADEVAQAAGTIPHELFCRVGRRLPRIYLRDGRPVAIAATVPAAVRPVGIEVR
ncbi:MAG: alanine racemase [Armatimonadota bacterium]|nr:alanine racemase [Armatimonadota bacterium]MDR7518875.1 alanine racemase [Armatimonadota bacterium]MDR7549104.1 alanine racemase [Armatimonadota bacterium]